MDRDRQFFAHSTSAIDRSDWQLLASHLLDTGAGAAARAQPFGGQGLAELAGRLHDLGKYTGAFQERLRGETPRVDHATWGARIARQRYGPLGTLIAYGIAGHHAGLADGAAGQPGVTRSALQMRLSEEYRESNLPPLLDAWQQELPLPPTVALPEGFRPHPDATRRNFQLSLLARMVFSCLVDADFVDTDNFYRGIEGRPGREHEIGPCPGLAELRERLDAHLAGFPQDGGINPLRGRILRHVRSQAMQEAGLFSLTVPTGGGKTLASLAFALDHAIAHGLRRVIYVIPFTSIVEQTAQVFREAFGELGDRAVLEHHSAFFDHREAALQGIAKRRLAMENWDAPVVVTTAVQFFESLFADRPSRCRKLHNIAGSVVILDEAQTLPLPLLRPCVALLDELARNYRTSLVLCTATQPALSEAQGFEGGLQGVRELAPDPGALYTQLRRVRVRHAGVLDDHDVTAHLREQSQVLCIVNNRRHARHLFQSIADLPGARHLTTLMYARHRSRVLADVRRMLKAGEPCRLVSTSLIEAGVDVDFPTVLRAEAGLDSIAQAAGRCNRDGRRAPQDSHVIVFENANGDWAPPPELRRFAEVFRETERRHRDDLLALAAVRDYFQTLYWRLGANLLDRDDLLGLLRSAGIDSLPLETLAARFRIIQTTMRPVIVPFNPDDGTRITEVDRTLCALARGEHAGAAGASRQLQPYLVQVPQRGYDALVKAHAVELIAPERYGEQFARLINGRLYDARFGLHWDAPQFLESERLVV